ncbi:MAG TPA: LLM class flavin-dependent oxidoreductase [Streptosporangiaceae bacterium]|jgi:alkanesulfonate monooxygenase SsuD/methylene tetrahydromethanopterin reductase-like flavin-dependent oxidoreductase (luciferase family)
MSTQPAFAFGIFDSFDLGESSAGQVITSRLDFAVAAEAAGIGHYHVTEHHGTPLSVCPSPALFLAALSQRTTTMRIGTLVYVLPAYEPLRLAEEIATLDQLTHGRLDVGVGSGVSPYELAYFGIDAAEARDRYAETLAAVTDALATGRLTHRGVLLRDYDVELSVGVVQRPHPPLWYASSNTRSAEWAAANDVNFVGKWNGGSFAPAAEAYWQTWQARQEGSARPAPPRVGIAAHVCIGATDDEAVERFRKAGAVHFRHLLSLWHKNGNHAFDFMADLDAGMKSGSALVGSAQTVRDLLIEQVRQAPVNYFEATLAYGDLTPEEAHANLAAFAETVMPAVQEAAARRQPAVPAG